jgi:hypothetical protein
MTDRPRDPTFLWTKKGGLPIVNEWGSARYVSAQAFIAMQLVRLESDGGQDRTAAAEQRVQAYGCFAQQVMRQVLGESGTSLVIGVGVGRQLCRPAHRGSSCPADLKEPCDCRHLYSAGCNPNALVGALVGGVPHPAPGESGATIGPDAENTFADNREDYRTNEPALDYQVSLVGGLAGVTAGLAGAVGPSFPSWEQCRLLGLVFPLPPVPTGVAALDLDSALGAAAGKYQMGHVHGGVGATLDWDPVGLILFGGFLLCVAGYHSVYWLRRRREAARWDPVAAGALRLAAARGDVGLMRLLARRAAQPKKSAKKGRCAGGKGRTSAAWAGPDAAALDGWTPLHAACVQGQTAAVEWLCAHGSDVMATKHDDWQDTPLLYAAAAGARACCDALMDYGADPAALNFAARTPADAAETAGHPQLAAHLRAAAAAAAKTNGDGESRLKPRRQPLDGAAHAKSLDLDTPLSNGERAAATALCAPDFQGMGTPGTQLARFVIGFRVLTVLTYAAWTGYLAWRALRTLGDGLQPLVYLYSIPFWLAVGLFGFVRA